MLCSILFCMTTAINSQSEITEEELATYRKVQSRNGKKGMQSRWSKYTPEERKTFLDKLQAGRARYQAERKSKSLPVQ